MLLQKERELVVKYGKKMSADHITSGTAGNISIYNADKGLLAISPTGMDYFETSPEDVVVTDLDLNIVDSKRKPSSELALHAEFYRNKPGIRAVVHAHSIYCTTFAVLNQPLRAVHYCIGSVGAPIVPVAPYHMYGTEELAKDTIKVCGKGNAVLLANHGVVTCGTDIESAYGLLCSLEFLAQVQYQSMCIGKPTILDDAQMDCVIEKFKSYGQ